MQPSCRRAGFALVLVAVLALVSSAPAAANDLIGPTYFVPRSQTVPPPTFRLSAAQALSIAGRLPIVVRARRAHPDLVPVVYIASPGVWELDWAHRRELAQGSASAEVQVLLSGTSGRMLAGWSGRLASDYQARGHLSRTFDQPWLWAILCVAFLLPFVDLRRPRRLIHLDLVVLLSFGIAYFFATHGQLGTWVALIYPPLAYLLVRMLLVARRPTAARERLVPHLPIWTLAFGLVALVGLRIALNIDARQVIDAGAAGVVGAYRMLHHLPLWGHSPGHADTYGPLLYIAYIPFELALPWRGHWTGTLAAAHAASITFDLLTIVGLYVLGKRLRPGRPGRELGLVLAYGWAAFPFTLFTLISDTNDALIAMLLVYALVALTSPVARGALVALAAAAKFAPLALVPLLAAGRRRDARGATLTIATAILVFAGIVLLYLPKDGGLTTFWNATVGFQLTRRSDFSLWALHPSLGALQTVFGLLTAALALGVAVFPRRRDATQVAALAAAVLIATELTARYWFFYYTIWFLPFVLAALFGRYSTAPRERVTEEIETAAIVGVPTPAAS